MNWRLPGFCRSCGAKPRRRAEQGLLQQRRQPIVGKREETVRKRKKAFEKQEEISGMMRKENGEIRWRKRWSGFTGTGEEDYDRTVPDRL